MATIEARTLRTPEGLHDDRADAYALAVAGLAWRPAVQGSSMVEARIRYGRMSKVGGEKAEGGASTGSASERGAWIELRDERGKLRAKWNPRARVLEIGARGEVERRRG